jgi:hypothetical protein
LRKSWSICRRTPFDDTGVTGRWRDNSLKLVSYKLYRRSFSSSARVSLGSSPIDYVLIK